MCGWLDLRLPGAPEISWCLSSCYVVHVGEGGVVWMGQVVCLGALDVRAGDCAGLGFEVGVVGLEYAFQAAAGAPVFCAAGDAREVEEDDAFAVGFDQGDEAAVGDIGFAPPARCVGYPAGSFDVQDLDAVCEEGAYEAATTRAGGFSGWQVCPDGIVGCPMGFPGRYACPGLGIAEVCEKWAVKGEELDVQKVSMAVVHGVAIGYAHGGSFGGFGCAQDGDACAVEDGGSECAVLFVLDGGLDFFEVWVAGEGYGAFQYAGVHGGVKEVVFQTDVALCLDAGGPGSGAVAELEIGFSDHGDFAQCPGDARASRVFE